MAPPPKRHHFLPQFYLSYFTDSKNLLWEFDRETKIYDQKTPHGSAWGKHYYRYKGKDGETHTDIESGLFNRIETGAKPVIDKIDARKPISEEEMGIVSLFVAFQHTRVPDFEKLSASLSEAMIKSLTKRRFSSVEVTKKIIEEMDEVGMDADNNVSPEEVFDFVQEGEYTVTTGHEDFISTMLSLGMEIAGYIQQMEWKYLFAPTGSSFITSDSPLFLVPPKDYEKEHRFEGMGIATLGVIKMMPLTPRVCLSIGDAGTKASSRIIDKKQVRAINRSVAFNSDQFVYAKDKPLLERIIKDRKLDTWRKKQVVITSDQYNAHRPTK
jgi:hypothetical protein